jgi:hypothetical protein
MHKSIAFIAAALAIVSLPAKAETASEVHTSCKAVVRAKVLKDDLLDIPGNFESGFCWGAFASFQQISTFYREGEKTSLLGSCAPGESDRLQYIKIFSRYLDNHPQLGSEEFIAVAVEALREAFPCSGKPKN